MQCDNLFLYHELYQPNGVITRKSACDKVFFGIRYGFCCAFGEECVFLTLFFCIARSIGCILSGANGTTRPKHDRSDGLRKRKDRVCRVRKNAPRRLAGRHVKRYGYTCELQRGLPEAVQVAVLVGCDHFRSAERKHSLGRAADGEALALPAVLGLQIDPGDVMLF